MVVEHVVRKDGIVYDREVKSRVIPSKEQYREAIKQLTENGSLTTLVALRLGGELGLSRIELCNAEVSNIDRDHKRGLYIKIAKHVRRGSKKDEAGISKPVYIMRSREIPINISFYQLLLSYANQEVKYILKRKRGDNIANPFDVQHINLLYKIAEIPWSPHHSRHYFKNALMNWMRTNRQIDEELIKDLMGHKKNVTQGYGSISWDYKLRVVDEVFK